MLIYTKYLSKYVLTHSLSARFVATPFYQKRSRNVGSYFFFVLLCVPLFLLRERDAESVTLGLIYF